MKLRKLALTLTAAALLPVLAHAGGDSDAINASFERGFYQEPSVLTITSASGQEDPVNAFINAALNATPDPVLASFERDYYREPSELEIASISGEEDPLSVAISAALSRVDDPVLASFVRELYREPAAIAASSAGSEMEAVNEFINTVSLVKKPARIAVTLSST